MRLPLAMLLCLIVAPAAFASAGTTGDGVLELKGVNALRVTIAGTRGAIWGQIDKGTLRVTDLGTDRVVRGARWLVLLVLRARPGRRPRSALFPYSTSSDLQRRGSAERRHPDDVAGAPDVSLPSERRGLLDRDPSLHRGGQHAVPIDRKSVV